MTQVDYRDNGSSWGTQAYSFDHANNMSVGTTPWTFSATGNRLLARPNCPSFVYAAAGNQTSRVTS